MKTVKLFQLKSGLAAVLALALLLPASVHAVSTKFTSSGSFTPPAGVTSITVECWGGGGAGGSAQDSSSAGGATGAGGGAYAKKLSIPVTPGTPYTVTIPAAVTAPASGFVNNQVCASGANVTFTGDSSVSVTANGGAGGQCAVNASSGSGATGGLGGAVSGSYDVEWAGGNGARSAGNGGGGGGAASDLGAGNNAATTSAGAAKTGSDADHNGGIGGAGRTGSGAGNAPASGIGGGGAGARVNVNPTTFQGGAGAKGQIIITYSGATVTKTNNTDNLNLGSSWVGGNAPDSSGTAKWDNTVTSPNTTVLGANVAWGSILIADPAGLVTISAGNTLTNNGGIDMSSATTNLTLNCSYALGNSAIWNVASSQTLTMGGAVSGGSGLNITKQGSGKLILSGANTYSGATTISGGTLQLGASGVIPDGSGKGDVSLSGGSTLDLNGYSETVNGLTGASGTFVDNTAAGTTSTLTVGSNNVTSTFSGVIQNSGSLSTNNLVKTGSGQLALSGANTFTGTVTVNDGNLTLGTANPLGNISGLTIVGAQLGLNANNAVISAPITLSGSSTVIAQSSSMLLTSLNGPIGGTGNLTFTTVANTLGGVDSKVAIGAAGNFVGNVTITTGRGDFNNMTVRLGAANALPTTAVVTLDGLDNNPLLAPLWSDLNLNGNDQTLAGLKVTTRTNRLQRVYNSSGTAATLTISNSANYSFGGDLGNTSGGGDNLGLTKSGAGTFTLSGVNNTYANGTIINGGTLLANNASGSGTGAGNVTVNSGGTLGGTGIISGLVTNNSGGTLSPGSSGIGTLTLNGNVVLNVGSTNTFEVDGTTPTNDVVTLAGTVTYGGVLKIVPTGVFTNTQTFTLFSGGGATDPSNFGSIVVSPTVSGTSFTFTNGVLTAVVVTGPSGPGTITNSVSGGVLTLQWPAGQSWRLVSQTNSLSVGLITNSSAWNTVPGGIDGSNSLTINPANPTVFYKLIYP